MTGAVIPLGARLRQRREELGLSQAQVARELDVARTAYRLWEMEAARPAPDRWRVIANWLGISMTALLLAGELLDAQEALASERTASAAGHTTETWDETSAAADGDFFSQERMMIAEQRSSGRNSAPDALALREMLRRIQDVSAGDTATPWHPGHFAKRFPSSAFAPALARAALTATAAEIPSDTFAAAALLTSELVTNSVTHAGSAWIDVAITLRRDRVRVEVSDQSVQAIRPRLGATDAGWGLALIGELATRWGTDRTDTGKTIWFELALSP